MLKLHLIKVRGWGVPFPLVTGLVRDAFPSTRTNHEIQHIFPENGGNTWTQAYLSILKCLGKEQRQKNNVLFGKLVTHNKRRRILLEMCKQKGKPTQSHIKC